MGVGLYQGMEFVLQRGAGDVFAQARPALERAAAARGCARQRVGADHRARPGRELGGIAWVAGGRVGTPRRSNALTSREPGRRSRSPQAGSARASAPRRRPPPRRWRRAPARPPAPPRACRGRRATRRWRRRRRAGSVPRSPGLGSPRRRRSTDHQQRLGPFAVIARPLAQIAEHLPAVAAVRVPEYSRRSRPPRASRIETSAPSRSRAPDSGSNTSEPTMTAGPARSRARPRRRRRARRARRSPHRRPRPRRRGGRRRPPSRRWGWPRADGSGRRRALSLDQHVREAVSSASARISSGSPGSATTRSASGPAASRRPAA